MVSDRLSTLLYFFSPVRLKRQERTRSGKREKRLDEIEHVALHTACMAGLQECRVQERKACSFPDGPGNSGWVGEGGVDSP
jgi:hypothetical protein